MDIEPMQFAKNGDKYCLIVPQQADKCTCSNSRWLLIAILDFSTFFTTVICLTHILCIYAAHQFWVICFPLAQHMFFFFGNWSLPRILPNSRWPPIKNGHFEKCPKMPSFDNYYNTHKKPTKPSLWKMMPNIV